MFLSYEDKKTPPCSRWRFLFVFAVFSAGAAGCSKPIPSSQLRLQASAALARGDYEQAETLSSKISSDAPEWQAAQLIAGEAASKLQRIDDAIRYYLAAGGDLSTADGRLAMFSAAEIFLDQGRLAKAEDAYRDVLKFDPANGVTNSRMALLLAMTGRRWETLEFFYALIKGGDASYRELGIAADVGRQIQQPEFLEKWQARNPDGKLTRLAVATDDFRNGETRALGLLKKLVADFPDIVVAQAMLGELLVESANPDDFTNWHAALPVEAVGHPDIWYVRGLWARKRSDLATAAACFRRTAVDMPFHRRAFTALEQVLAATDDPLADEVAVHAKQMVRVTQLVDKILAADGDNEPAIKEVTSLMEKQGRIWDAVAWAVVARKRFPDSRWYDDVFERCGGKLNDEQPWIDFPVRGLSQQQFVTIEVFSAMVAAAGNSQLLSPPETGSASIQFEESNGIAFQYFNGDDPTTEGIRTFEQTGGGVGVIDFDMDGVPDVFLPQGSEWGTGSKRPTPSGKYRDRLFRNVGAETFTDITEVAVDNDSGFGQGCSVGDYDNDGFPDLYVATTGRNRLYRNLGDGTFEDVTNMSQTAPPAWTASATICDLNADGLPDIYDVNYLTGDDVFQKICRKRGCSPSVFPGAIDQLLINQGDGTFSLMPNLTPTSDAKGLGVVVFESQQDRRPSLFVANDQVANFLLKSVPSNNSANLNLENSAIVTGLAFNDQGLAMACMGVAIDDFDANGLMDLFTTNFQEEPNTVYLQDTPGLYRDATNAAGLLAASYAYTGWGTQAMDADLDGLPDLVVANGHVDDGRPYGGDYFQKPQFFRNIGGKFEELPAQRVGPWFDGEYLGRGLAKLDWNLDGRTDFIVSNMNSPVAVLKNTSDGVGAFLRVKLHASQTARDAIGARVTVTFGNQTVTRQLVAGDGYMASNERVVEFGLGDCEMLDTVQIAWPSGARSQIKSLAVDCLLHVTEGRMPALQSASGQLISVPTTFQPAN